MSARHSWHFKNNLGNITSRNTANYSVTTAANRLTSISRYPYEVTAN